MEFQDIYMQRCLQLAAYGNGFVAPNPLVGAVLVNNDRIIGEGFHHKYGEAHAEVNCINNVDDSHRHLIPDSTMYVSLEPCAHFGKTPPCANLILSEGIKKVVIGSSDPFEEVNGKGIAILQSAGVEVIKDVLKNECHFQNRRFFTFHEKKRPYIHLKWAQTLDGYMAGSNNKRLHITGQLTNRLVHKWRSEESAILVGTQTAITDNPKLTNRLWSGAQPLRMVIDRNLKLPETLNLFSDGISTVVLNGVEEKKSPAIFFKKVEALNSENPAALLQALYEENIQSVLIEGGAALLMSLLRSGLWDEAHILTNSVLKTGGGIKAPVKPEGFIRESYYVGADLIEWMIN